ncbi:hypothetical protein Nepgr_032018 [Nepenthes gracilis]|uniref:Transmembrane protein n=1 Tax=Nepenthes gracilis TaxID=150966 RepID=A0AAD3TII7_NEPGR|nr:hypothetical protein Nepgr_032018 [Nepenthes gracilis]
MQTLGMAMQPSPSSPPSVLLPSPLFCYFPRNKHDTMTLTLFIHSHGPRQLGGKSSCADFPRRKIDQESRKMGSSRFGCCSLFSVKHLVFLISLILLSGVLPSLTSNWVLFSYHLPSSSTSSSSTNSSAFSIVGGI